MKRSFIHQLFLSLFFIVSTAFSQYPDWINYTNRDRILAIAVEGNTVWVRTSWA